MATAHPTLTRSADPADRSASSTTRTEKGISLARGPALILGTILLAAGLYFLYKAHSFPRFSNLPNGTPHKDGNFFLGIFGANGWTGELTAVGGGLLLFGAAHHVLAKTMSLIVGIALGAAAIIAVVSGNVLGMAATNGWTELGWGISAAILLFNSMIPRRTRTIETEAAAGGVAAGGAATHERRRERRDLAAEETGAGVAGAGVAGAGVAGAGAGVARNRGGRAEDRGMVDDGSGMAGDGSGMAGERDVTSGNRQGAAANRQGAAAYDPATATNQRATAGEPALADNRGAGSNEPLMARDEAVRTNGGAGATGPDEAQMVENQPRRFERSDEVETANGTADGEAATGRRRSGGLLSGLLHRD